ncbi:C-C motif chemokine 3-like [Polypterus senegalus]|uniref:C-C motif chemokine 3-like n=1 Tax=Polypterus senegalus TaxID=55291 RepID=UPI0019657DA1|nr:C-C motif chemokine 3-like [Polypterus senegalus]
MKSHLLIVVGLFGIICSEVFAQNANRPLSCCFKFQKTPIPRRFFVGYETTRDDCPQLGVILFAANKKKEVCVNPDDAWVIKYMNYFDRLSLLPAAEN